MVFDWEKLKETCESFFDSIIVELCFPKAPYPKFILYQILHDAIVECPNDAKRFPQALWDALGDLSVSLERSIAVIWLHVLAGDGGTAGAFGTPASGI